MISEAEKLKIKQRYLTEGISLRALAKETGMPYSTLKNWNQKEGWAKERASIDDEAFKKAAVDAVNNKARELCKLLKASDELEKALLLAAKAFTAYLRGEGVGESLPVGADECEFLPALEGFAGQLGLGSLHGGAWRGG